LRPLHSTASSPPPAPFPSSHCLSRAGSSEAEGGSLRVARVVFRLCPAIAYIAGRGTVFFFLSEKQKRESLSLRSLIVVIARLKARKNKRLKGNETNQWKNKKEYRHQRRDTRANKFNNPWYKTIRRCRSFPRGRARKWLQNAVVVHSIPPVNSLSNSGRYHPSPSQGRLPGLREPGVARLGNLAHTPTPTTSNTSTTPNAPGTRTTSAPRGPARAKRKVGQRPPSRTNPTSSSRRRSSPIASLAPAPAAAAAVRPRDRRGRTRLRGRLTSGRTSSPRAAGPAPRRRTDPHAAPAAAAVAAVVDVDAVELRGEERLRRALHVPAELHQRAVRHVGGEPRRVAANKLTRLEKANLEKPGFHFIAPCFQL
jgi:hypothetical protein